MLPRPGQVVVGATGSGYLTTTSQQLAEILYRQTGVFDDAAHGVGVDGIGARDGQKALTVRHHDVLALTDNAKAGFLQCADGMEMIDAGKLRHLRRDLDLAHVGATGRFLDRGQILFDGVVDVAERFLLGLSLRPAARKARAVNAIAFVSRY